MRENLSKDHTEALPLVGRNLTPLLYGHQKFFGANEPVYFMTDDNVFKGLQQTNAITGKPYKTVVEPSDIEAVITKLETGKDKSEEIWKFARYFDNPKFWTVPGSSDTVIIEQDGCCVPVTKTEPVPEQYELYNLTKDPLEKTNLADPAFATIESAITQRVLARYLRNNAVKRD